MNIEQATEELFASTRWGTEKRCGVEHYQPGQVKVREVEPEDGERNFMLAYTPADGHGICAFACRKRALETDPGSVFGNGPMVFWEIVDNVRVRADGLGFSIQQIDGYVLSRAMAEALDQAFGD